MRTASRPELHFTARRGWINDPLGLTWHEGRYHLFFQYLPDQVVWGPACRWGHATSPDLLTWAEENPEALIPEPGEGCWSGNIVSTPSLPGRIFYTSVALKALSIGAIRVADAQNSRWQRWDKGPVVVTIPPSEPVVAFRDPFVFHDGTTWRMLVGAGRPDGTALALGYASEDLTSWVYTGVAASRPSNLDHPVWTGEVWECPQLLRVDGRWVLTFSAWTADQPHYQAYAIGDFQDGRFTAESWGRLSYGPSYYAGSVFHDQTGQPGIIYWLRSVLDPDGTWAGAHSIPHELSIIGADLIARPTSALRSRRRNPTTIDGTGQTQMSGPAYLNWRPDQRRPSTITFGRITASLQDGGLTVSCGAESWSCPSSDDAVEVIIDHGVIEFFPPSAVLAVPHDLAVGPLDVHGGHVEVYDL